MKNFLFTAVLFLTIASNAQSIVPPKPQKNIPVAVSQAFTSKFPSQDPVWFSQYQGRYDQKLVFEARFIFDKRYSTAVYDNEGNMIAFAATVEKREVPQPAIAYMNEKFPSYPIVDAMLVTRGQNKPTYEIGIFIEKQFVIHVFSESGDFIKSTKA